MRNQGPMFSDKEPQFPKSVCVSQMATQDDSLGRGKKILEFFKSHPVHAL